VIPRRRATIVLACALLYVILRIVLVPHDPSTTHAFTHDSGYIGIVSRNVTEGKGLINDAHWALFLNPPKLPMAFHNANPLYVLGCAYLAKFLNINTPYAGCIVSIVGQLLLGVGAFFLVRRFHSSFGFAILCAAGVMLFPQNWLESFAVLPDALATGLCLCALAMVVWATRGWHWLAAGVLFGLAWLTRSTALLILPAAILWILLRHGLRRTIFAACLFAIAALAIMSPWLYHTAITRGSPFASDAGNSWLQDFNAARTNRTVAQYWRSLTPPEPPGQTVRTHFVELAVLTLKGIPKTIHYLLGFLTGSNKLRLGLLLAAALAGTWLLGSRWRTPEIAAVCLLAATNLISVAVRAETTQPNYFGVTNCFLALLILIPFASWRKLHPIWLAIPALAYAFIAAIPQDVQIARNALSPDPHLVEFRQLALDVSQHLPPGQAVIAVEPYFFTYFTGRSAISPPYPGKPELLDVMNRYNATLLLLPEKDEGLYYPGAPASLLPELSAPRSVGPWAVFAK
jgi:hypothetical protein